MRDYSVASVSFGSLIGLTRGRGPSSDLGIKAVSKFWKQALAAIWSRNTRSGRQAPVLAAKTLVLRAIAEEGRKGGKVSSICATFGLWPAQLPFHLGYKLEKGGINVTRTGQRWHGGNWYDCFGWLILSNCNELLAGHGFQSICVKSNCWLNHWSIELFTLWIDALSKIRQGRSHFLSFHWAKVSKHLL